MKKLILFIFMIFVVTGCNKIGTDDLIKNLNNKIKNSKNYQIIATLEINRNEEKFIYDVISTYKNGGYFKVDLTNKENNHQQIILRDNKSVYVLTPSLNKSFKFQSEWPYNNSQIYLLQPIITDVENDKNSKFEQTKSGYIITSSVNYTSEKNFVTQRIYFNSEKNITKVEVLDKEENVKMSLNIVSIEFDVKLEDDLFNVDKYQKQEPTPKNDTKSNTENTITSLDEIIYPMYVPAETYLTGQNVVSTDFGERVILTFSGESQFTLVQENPNETENNQYVYGDPYLILDTVGSITDYSVSWISNGVEYSVMSDSMEIDELLTVAQSINVKAVGK